MKMNVKRGDIWGGTIGRGQAEFYVVLKVSEMFVTLAKLGKTEKAIGGGMIEVAPVVPESLAGLRGKRVKHYLGYRGERTALVGALRVERAPESYRVQAVPCVAWAV